MVFSVEPFQFLPVCNSSTTYYSALRFYSAIIYVFIRLFNAVAQCIVRESLLCRLIVVVVCYVVKNWKINSHRPRHCKMNKIHNCSICSLQFVGDDYNDEYDLSDLYRPNGDVWNVENDRNTSIRMNICGPMKNYTVEECKSEFSVYLIIKLKQ